MKKKDWMMVEKVMGFMFRAIDSFEETKKNLRRSYQEKKNGRPVLIAKPARKVKTKKTSV